MGKTLTEMLASRSADSQQRIKDMADELMLEVRLQAVREELEVSQVELASALGITQPAIVKLEQRGSDVKLSTMKRYVEAMGGKLRVDVELPTGRHIGFNV
ncbi:TPA: helix-turn-helix transcriptional regulator [Aeromonas hydrophila]|jgi:predicted transcriptional regulator|uniref:helix-turn-helix domain-containing protein n=1 Tax=Aeromonas hydrophila TaxID=644 RepID=UPI001A1878C4|nr:helix-turn-helix transcriptional regulator [Aeromonas hydrophila]HAT3533950.1 helix-turn-helix transcriptional regulator [Aeromonas hydrophila]